MGLLLICFFLFVHTNGHPDIYIRDGVISYGQCQRLLNYGFEEPIQLLPSDTQEAKDLYPIFHTSIELYLEQGGFNVYPSITNDTGYMYYRYCDANTTRLSIPPLGTYVGAFLFLNGNKWSGGGEWSFPRQNLTIHPQCGRMLLFPTFFTYPHIMNPVRKGDFLEFMATWFK